MLYVRVHRRCAPQLWHLFHTKRAWSTSLDGVQLASEQQLNERLKELKMEDENKNASGSIAVSGVSGSGTASWKLPMPNDDGPTEIIHRGALDDFICQQAAMGKIYIKRRLPEEEAP